MPRRSGGGPGPGTEISESSAVVNQSGRAVARAAESMNAAAASLRSRAGTALEWPGRRASRAAVSTA
ncbi:hypothetical protein [Streptomyces sp. NBC_00211]|uniref:hypothetical protein n=1 Tax=Streptomyces sp. NBC_00211 TaxID=2975683 RepID=UPI00324CEC7C